MRICKYLVIVFLFSYLKTSANQETGLLSSYKNVKFSVEGISWSYAWLSCILINKLAESYNYNDTIYFISKKIDKLYPQNVYYISYDNKPYFYEPLDSKVKQKSLVIGDINNDFNIEKILNLEEYAFKNIELIKRTQKSFSYNDISYNLTVKSIDTSMTRAITREKSSALIKNIISKKTFVPQYFMFNNCNYRYYFQNGKYFVVHKNKLNKVILPALYSVNLIAFDNPNLAVVFETDSTFYFINQSVVSKKFTIKINNLGYCEYSNIERKGKDIFFEFHYWKRELSFTKSFELSEIRKFIIRTYVLNIGKQELLQNKDSVETQDY